MFKKTLLLAALSTSVAFAEKPSLKGAWEFGPFAGFNWLDKYNGAIPDNADILGARLGYFFTDRVSVEGSFQRHFAPGAELDSSRLNLLYHLTSGTMVRPFLTVGAGWERTDISASASAESDYGLNAGGGLKVIFANGVGLRVDGRYNTLQVDGLVGGNRQHNTEILAGVSWFFGAKAAKEEPKPVGDSDSDGVNDDLDKCPGTGAGVKVDASGCEVKVVVAAPLDSDSDGVSDDMDKCPGTPAGVVVDAAGCPADEDGDGVPNYLDKCPKTPAGIKIDETGCPEEVKKVRGALKGIGFKTGSATLLTSSYPVLDEAARILNDITDAKIEVQGHTDSTGSEAINQKLSDGRAKSVADYLIKAGVPADRISSKGFGPSVPVGDNATKEGRAQNRRVEFKWLD